MLLVLNSGVLVGAGAGASEVIGLSVAEDVIHSSSVVSFVGLYVEFMYIEGVSVALNSVSDVVADIVVAAVGLRVGASVVVLFVGVEVTGGRVVATTVGLSVAVVVVPSSVVVVVVGAIVVADELVIVVGAAV